MIIDLVRVRKGREKLAILAEKYPELRGERSAANVAQWEKTLQTIGKNEMEYVKNCKYILCGKEFTAARKDKDFCCDAHRTASHKFRNDEPSDLARLMTRAVEFDAQFYAHPSNPTVKRVRDGALRDVHTAIMHELGLTSFPGNRCASTSLSGHNCIKRVDGIDGKHTGSHESSIAEFWTDDESLEAERKKAHVDAPVEAAPVEAHVDAPVEAAPVEAHVVREKLRAFMAETSFGQRKIAELAGVGQSRISVFLAGKTDGSEAFRQSILAVVDRR